MVKLAIGAPAAIDKTRLCARHVLNVVLTKLMRTLSTKEIKAPDSERWLQYWHVCIMLYEFLERLE